MSVLKVQDLLAATGGVMDAGFARGAAGVITDRKLRELPPGRWQIEVAGARQALWRAARWQRKQFAGEVIAVSGDVGKTITRQMVAAVLEQASSDIERFLPLDETISVPLRMLSWDSTVQADVIELGSAGGREVATLAELCAPRLGIITHLRNAPGTLDDQLELLAALPSNGWLILNGDEERLRRLRDRTRAQTFFVGRSGGCDLLATEVRCTGGRLGFVVDGQRVEVPVWGRHHLNAALAAWAVGKLMGVRPRDIAERLRQFRTPPARCEVSQLRGATIINDAYNASPTAMRAALELLRDFDVPGRRVVICGDLHDDHGDLPGVHREIGREVVTRCGADMLLAVGPHAADLVAGARAAGMPFEQAVACEANGGSAAHWESLLAEGNAILVKAPRSMALELFFSVQTPESSLHV
jgi:UDP-N-acetylmuramoyl-tripeptide--D-alanyl-D-alanine ligase